MDVVLLEQPRTPRLPEARRPLLPESLPALARHLRELPVEHRQLVRRGAFVARAAEAIAERQLHDIALGRANETCACGPVAREALQRLERATQVWPHERPAQPPRILGVDVAGHEHLTVDRQRLQTRIARVGDGRDLQPGPLLQRRVRVVALPRERREPHEPAARAVDTDDRLPLDRELIGREGLRERENVALDARPRLRRHASTAREASTISTTLARPRSPPRP